jgi:hypothetical protein
MGFVLELLSLLLDGVRQGWTMKMNTITKGYVSFLNFRSPLAGRQFARIDV